MSAPQYAERFASLLEANTKVLFAFVDDATASLVHDVRVALRGKAELFVATKDFQKKLIALRAADGASESGKLIKEKLAGDATALAGNVALLFTSENVASIQSALALHKVATAIEIVTAAEVKAAEATVEEQLLNAVSALTTKSFPGVAVPAASPHAVFGAFKSLLAGSAATDFVVESFEGQKLAHEVLEQFENKNCTEHFGAWANDIEGLQKDFAGAAPFGHVKIDNFLDPEYAEALYQAFPTDLENWHRYNNPIEVKYANDNLDGMPECIRNVFYMLSTKEMTDKFAQMSDIENLEYDPYLNGAGLHAHPRNGRLHIHLDYERHPKFENKDRRLNIILFLTKDWKEEWGGDNQLYDNDVKNCVVRTYPKFNSAIVFQTNDISWHGLPDAIKCPEGTLRKSLAYYYLSPALDKTASAFGSDSTGLRHKAAFCKRPQDEDLPQMQKLYALRPKRRIEPEDMKEIWPEWTPELF